VEVPAAESMIDLDWIGLDWKKVATIKCSVGQEKEE
jgi:hypothetical protein